MKQFNGLQLIQYFRLMQKGYEKVTDEFFINKSCELGRGNFGKVYKGYYLTQNKIIAIKFMDKQMLAKSPGYERQLEVMKSLTKIRHPNIMDYYGYHLNEKGLYCFLQFCGGGTLKSFIAAEQKISEFKVVTLYKQMLSAMSYINSLNKVHRDIKPDNILLDQNSEIKIADFGLAREVGISMTKGACTPLYAAPQVLNGEPYDEKCDVWSAGLILYEMLIGAQYFKHVKTKAQLIAECNSFSKTTNKIHYPPELNEQWQIFTNMMLTFSPLKRPSFINLLNEFQKVQGKLKQSLGEKYGQSAIENDVQLNLTKTVSPYLARPKNENMTIQKKFQEERSYENLVKLRKYLTFYRLKSQILIKLVKEFTNNTYGCLKNVYKYILMFLSLCAYISRINNHLNQIKNKKMSTPDGPLANTDFNEEHLIEVMNLIKEFSIKHQTSKSKFQAILQKQITNKITTNYMKREQENKIIQSICSTLGDVQELINRSLKHDFDTEDTYMDIYRKLMNHPDVKVSLNTLSGFNENDIKTYAIIRMIGNLDQIFHNGFYKQQDYIRIKKQDIENRKGESLLEFVKQWNN